MKIVFVTTVQSEENLRSALRFCKLYFSSQKDHEFGKILYTVTFAKCFDAFEFYREYSEFITDILSPN